MNRRRLPLLGLIAAVVLGLVVTVATPAGAQFVNHYLARTFTSTAPSGVNGFACKVNGCRVDLGTAAGDYLASDGTGVVFGGRVTVPAGTYIANSGTLNNTNSLFTCAAAWEGFLMRQSGTGGTNTLTQTRLCVCVSDGAASPTYSWRNVISGTAGNATTCNP